MRPEVIVEYLLQKLLLYICLGEKELIVITMLKTDFVLMGKRKL